MRLPGSVWCALVFGFAHLIVQLYALFFLHGEQGLFIVFLDLPIVFLAQFVAPRLLYNSELFGILAFCVGGTLMYSAFGYALGRLWHPSNRGRWS